MDRRQILKTLASALAAPLAAQPPAQAPKPATPGQPANQRRAPMVIVYSQNLVQIEYPELGDIVKQMGFDGVDLSIQPGGHVEPRLANVDLVRAFEVMEGNTLAVPVITTALTTAMDRTAVPVLALAGMSGARLFRPGNWSYGATANLVGRLAEVQRDLAGLLSIGRQYNIASAFYNGIGDNVGSAVWDIQRIIEPLDPGLSGFYFDVANAAAQGGGGWEVALKLALPRLKAVAIQDFVWEKQSDRWQMSRCPLGKGMIDWPKFFQMLAQAGFMGPVTLEIGYAAKDMPSAFATDLEFARKHIQTAWGIGPKT
jgi:L-ribulose-5-phosphate 3-epimerase